MTKPRSEIAWDAQSHLRKRSEARWLDGFAVVQLVFGLLYFWVGVSGVPENVLLFVPALAHVSLGWSLWARRRWFWLPHIVVLINPWVSLVLHRHYPPPPSPPHGFGLPWFVLFIPSAMLVVYVWEWFAFVILLARADTLLGPRRPFKLRLAGFLAGSALVACAVGLDVRPPLQRERKQRDQNENCKAAAAEFLLAAEQQDKAAIAAARQRILQLQDRHPQVLNELSAGLKHQDPRVRLETIRLYATPSGRRRWGVLFMFEENELLAIIANDGESDAIRLAAVNAFLRTESCHGMFTILAGLGDKAVFAVPAVADAVGDVDPADYRSNRSPEDAIVFLKNLGPLAKEAVPELAAALERYNQWIDSQTDHERADILNELAASGHWNQWNYGARLAEALEAIGPEAAEAIPALLAATKSDIQEVRVAAVAALRRVAPGTFLDEAAKPLSLEP